MNVSAEEIVEIITLAYERGRKDCESDIGPEPSTAPPPSFQEFYDNGYRDGYAKGDKDGYQRGLKDGKTQVLDAAVDKLRPAVETYPWADEP